MLSVQLLKLIQKGGGDATHQVPTDFSKGVSNYVYGNGRIWVLNQQTIMGAGAYSHIVTRNGAPYLMFTPLWMPGGRLPQ